MEKKFLVTFIDGKVARLNKEELADMINACMDSVHGHDYVQSIEIMFSQ